MKGGHTNPDISKLRDSTESGAHWESNPLSRSKKVFLAKTNKTDNTTPIENIKKLILEEDSKRAIAANKLKDMIELKLNEPRNQAL